MTMEELNKLNRDARNGFQFDGYYYIQWREKRLVREIPDKFGFWEIIIEWYRTSQPWDDAKTYIPIIKVRKMVKTAHEDIYQVLYPRFRDGDGQKRIGPQTTRKNYKELCKYSQFVNADAIIREIKLQGEV